MMTKLQPLVNHTTSSTNMSKPNQEIGRHRLAGSDTAKWAPVRFERSEVKLQPQLDGAPSADVRAHTPIGGSNVGRGRRGSRDTDVIQAGVKRKIVLVGGESGMVERAVQFG